ncbi:hypothetical protein [Thalassospira tepidiphila]|uniref:Uncharacterized protein n=2 Tax=Thalassospira tepidiphila TaxID=393657 RepID=A0A853KVT2_9PROT|nr:hypothetical protein [Thalassospira tepidiphila]NJB74604.1 hypothetical protein [Thalassospira tepidiphila]OAZ08066.1 hypothetical protein TH4_18610 [Thalassospira tepidiphila MCCC 1A03514]
MPLSEFARAAINTTAAQDGWLIGEGVDPAWLYGRMARYGTTKAKLHDNGTWEPDPNGVGVIVVPEIPVLGSGGILSFERGNLIACGPRQPGRMFRRDDTPCSMINPDAPDYARHFDIPLHVFSDPIRYLVGKQMGCVIVDWDEISAFALTGPSQIICDTLEIAEQIDRLFKAARAPEIHIQQNEVQGAA